MVLALYSFIYFINGGQIHNNNFYVITSRAIIYSIAIGPIPVDSQSFGHKQEFEGYILVLFMYKSCKKYTLFLTIFHFKSYIHHIFIFWKRIIDSTVTFPQCSCALSTCVYQSHVSRNNQSSCCACVHALKVQS